MSTSLHSVSAPVSEKAFLGNEPVWFDMLIPDDKYNSQLMRGLNWHGYVASEKNYRKYLEEWMKQHRKTFKTDIQHWREIPDNKIDVTICKLARMHMQGFPLSEKHTAMLNVYVDSLHVEIPQKSTVQKSSAPTISIQDRMRQQVSGILSDLDVEIDNAFDGNEIDVEKIKGDVLASGFKGPQLKIITDHLLANLNEWKSAYNKEDEQLVEGYSYVGPRKFKRIIDSFDEIISAVSQQVTKLQSQRIVKKKAVDKRKVASKLKFMKEFAEMNLKSVDAVDIIGANVVWVYDTKKRRLGYYEGEAKNSLFIRGTMIDGYKVTCEKVLRKPEEQIPEILKLRKNQTVNWFGDIRAKCKEMNGRTNPNLILLRID